MSDKAKLKSELAQEESSPDGQPEESQTTPSASKQNSAPWYKQPLIWVGIIILLVLGGGIAYLSTQMATQPAENAVATVGDEQITQTELDSFFEQQRASYESQGMDLSNADTMQQARSQALDTLVNQTLLLQGAAEDGIEVTQEDVQAQVDQTVAQFDTDEAFQQALADNNLTEAGLRENISTQLTIQQYLAQYVDQDVEVTDQEVQDLYDQYSQNSENVPPFAQVSDQLRSQLEQQKISEQVNQIIEGLRQQTEIEVML